MLVHVKNIAEEFITWEELGEVTLSTEVFKHNRKVRYFI